MELFKIIYKCFQECPPNFPNKRKLKQNNVIEIGAKVKRGKAFANAFNELFSPVGKAINSAVPTAKYDYKDYFKYIHFKKHVANDKTIEGISTITYSLQSTKSTGPSSIPRSLLKVAGHLLSKPL